MKLAVFAALIFSMSSVALAGTSADRFGKLRFADASAEACFASCANDNASCKRVCPTTLGTPCLSACDSQAQTCRQGCRSR